VGEAAPAAAAERERVFMDEDGERRREAPEAAGDPRCEERDPPRAVREGAVVPEDPVRPRPCRFQLDALEPRADIGLAIALPPDERGLRSLVAQRLRQHTRVVADPTDAPLGRSDDG
jgi:hypothetical protein